VVTWRAVSDNRGAQAPARAARRRRRPATSRRPPRRSNMFLTRPEHPFFQHVACWTEPRPRVLAVAAAHLHAAAGTPSLARAAWAAPPAAGHSAREPARSLPSRSSFRLSRTYGGQPREFAREYVRQLSPTANYSRRALTPNRGGARARRRSCCSGRCAPEARSATDAAAASAGRALNCRTTPDCPAPVLRTAREVCRTPAL
jgi:hypothetical protein